MPEVSLAPSSDAARISIREAHASDVARLAELEAEAFDSDRLSRRSLSILARSPSASLLVAARGGELLGYALVLFRRGSRSARLYSLAVARRAGGAGLGRMLLGAAETAAQARGTDRLTLEVRGDNAAAIRLYERAGYSHIGERENYYSDGMAARRYAGDLQKLCRPDAGAKLGEAA